MPGGGNYLQGALPTTQGDWAGTQPAPAPASVAASAPMQLPSAYAPAPAMAPAPAYAPPVPMPPPRPADLNGSPYGTLDPASVAVGNVPGMNMRPVVSNGYSIPGVAYLNAPDSPMNRGPSRDEVMMAHLLGRGRALGMLGTPPPVVASASHGATGTW